MLCRVRLCAAQAWSGDESEGSCCRCSASPIDESEASAAERHALAMLQRPRIESDLVIRCSHVDGSYLSELKGVVIIRKL